VQKRLVLVCGASLEILKSCQGNRLGHGVVGVLHSHSCALPLPPLSRVPRPPVSFFGAVCGSKSSAAGAQSNACHSSGRSVGARAAPLELKAMCLDMPLQPTLTVVAAAPFPEGGSNPRLEAAVEVLGFAVEVAGCRWLSMGFSPWQRASARPVGGVQQLCNSRR
jgi:hypothetical protein